MTTQFVNALKKCHSGSCCDGKDDKDEKTAAAMGKFTFPMAPPPQEEPCCGAPSGPAASPYARPGYQLLDFVRTFQETTAGPVAAIKTRLSGHDLLGTIRARAGIRRDQYLVSPGLYCLGTPDQASPVLVTANYKLSFDTLRKELAGINCWLLALDTRGVNVWCAAGKKTFSTAEVIRQVTRARLDKIVDHRRLILPQLGAPGVSAQKVKQGCGFEVIWGPIRARDIAAFLEKGCQADASMREVTFRLRERAVLIPVEISLIIKPSLIIALIIFALSGIAPEIFSFAAAWHRGVWMLAAYCTGVVSGAILTPLLLPWLPARSFFIKGIIPGLATATVFAPLNGSFSYLETIALQLVVVAASSYAAMNFTGASPYTSPSGVEKEMRQGIPLQIILLLAAAVLWIWRGLG